MFGSSVEVEAIQVQCCKDLFLFLIQSVLLEATHSTGVLAHQQEC